MKYTHKMIPIKYELGQVVYLITDPDQRERIVTAIIIRPSAIIYELTKSDQGSSEHYEFEISNALDEVKKYVNP